MAYREDIPDFPVPLKEPPAPRRSAFRRHGPALVWFAFSMALFGTTAGAAAFFESEPVLCGCFAALSFALLVVSFWGTFLLAGEA